MDDFLIRQLNILKFMKKVILNPLPHQKNCSEIIFYKFIKFEKKEDAIICSCCIMNYLK